MGIVYLDCEALVISATKRQGGGGVFKEGCTHALSLHQLYFITQLHYAVGASRQVRILDITNIGVHI